MIRRMEISANEVVIKITDPTADEVRTDFQKHLDEILQGSWKVVSLDLSDLTAMLSSLLGKILMFRKKTLEEGRTLQIKGCSEELFKVFQSIKLDTVLSIQKK
jgi:anti-anti-sigma regulatory factor